MKCVALFSGGQDSIISVLLMKEQNIDVYGIYVDTGFFTKNIRAELIKKEQELGITIRYVNIHEQYVSDILFKPKFGYGKNLNPCVHCHANFLDIAWEYAKEIGASFLVSGEVLGQRGMSQTSNQMKKVDQLHNNEYVVRPLSAKVLPISKPEQFGWVDRHKLLDIKGRSRNEQIRIMKEHNIEPIHNGCLLTVKSYCAKIELFRSVKQDYNFMSYNLIMYGRVFRVGDSIVVIGRNHSDNLNLIEFFKTKNNDFKLIKTPYNKAPISAISIDASDIEFEMAYSKILNYVTDEHSYR